MSKLVKTDGYLFDELLWNYIKSFILVHECSEWCFNPGTILLSTFGVGPEMKYYYWCSSCFSNIMLQREKYYKKILYSRIRSEVSTKVIGVADLRKRIKAVSDKTLLRLLNIPKTIRNMRPLRSTLSHVFLHKIPQEEEEARIVRLKNIMKQIKCSNNL
jgi:hypothetical protein